MVVVPTRMNNYGTQLAEPGVAVMSLWTLRG